MMSLGFEDPAMLVEVALERMAQEELAESKEESPEYIEWVRSEVAIGIEQLDREEFSSRTPKEIRAEVLAAYQNRHGSTSSSKLVQDLWDSLSEEDISLTPEQKDELDRRKAAYQANPSSGSSWDDVKRGIIERHG
jgi:putative addiction module component (TIGR02574 family)